MIAHAATADALVLVPRGHGELAAGSRRPLPQPVGAAAGGSRPARRRARAREDERADELPERPARPPLARVGVRRVAPRGVHRELRRGRGAREHEEERERRDVADADQLEQVPRARRTRGRSATRARRRGSPGPSRPEREQRRGGRAAGRSGAAAARARRAARAATNRSAKAFVAATIDREHEQRHERDGVARELLLGGHRPPRREALARERPAEPRATTTECRASAQHRPVAGDRRSGVRAAAAGPAGHAPSRRKHVKTMPGEEPEAEAGCAAPVAAGAQRDVLAPAERVEVDDRDEQRDEQGDQDELDRPAADDRARRPRRSCRCSAGARGPGRASRAAAARRRRAARAARVERRRRCRRTRRGGRSPPVVIVIAGMPAPTNGPCS